MIPSPILIYSLPPPFPKIRKRSKHFGCLTLIFKFSHKKLPKVREVPGGNFRVGDSIKMFLKNKICMPNLYLLVHCAWSFHWWHPNEWAEKKVYFHSFHNIHFHKTQIWSIYQTLNFIGAHRFCMHSCSKATHVPSCNRNFFPPQILCLTFV